MYCVDEAIVLWKHSKCFGNKHFWWNDTGFKTKLADLTALMSLDMTQPKLPCQSQQKLCMCHCFRSTPPVAASCFPTLTLPWVEGSLPAKFRFVHSRKSFIEGWKLPFPPTDSWLVIVGWGQVCGKAITPSDISAWHDAALHTALKDAFVASVLILLRWDVRASAFSKEF